MKKLTALLLFSLLAAASLRAAVVWQESFNYTNGQVIVTSTNFVGGVMVTNWIRHSGSGNDAFVNNHRLENQATSGSLVNRADDIHRNFTAPYTNAPTILYASFILNCTNLPNAAGTYFAHFYTNTSIFNGKLFAMVGTNLCLPNTYRLGVSGASSTAYQIFPMDLATNQDYQVVIEWDPVNLWATTLWVSPASASDASVISSDTIAVQPAPAVAFGFRQAGSFGNWACTISNLVVATTYDEAATNVWPYNSVNPGIIYLLKPATNYVGVSAQLSIVAAGQGLAGFNYRWQKDGADYDNLNGNSNILPFPSPDFPDIGNYGVIVSNIFTGVTVTNPPVLMWVTNGPPIIITQPTNQAVYPGKNVTVSVAVQGTPMLTYSWLFNNGAPTNPNVDPTTTNTPNLVVHNIQSGNGTLGNYKCLISNDYGSTNSSAATLTLLTPQIVNIDALHGMVDSTLFLPTNTSVYYTISNAVVYTREVTNGDGTVNGGPFTGPANAEFFVQDSSGGICVFVGGGTHIQPRQGDIVTVTGPLNKFNSLLELSLSVSDPSTILIVTGHTNSLPAPVVLPFGFTNGSGAFVSVSNVIRHYEGLLVILTNVYFPGASVGTAFASGSYVMTNVSGGGFVFFLNSANTNIIGKPIPQFARTVTGPMSYFNSNPAATNLSAGFQMFPSAYSDIVAGPCAPVGASGGGTRGVVNWVAQPFLPYSVWWQTNVAAPFTNQWTPIATGLIFNTTSGTFSDSVNTNRPVGFYRISSP